MYNIVKGGTVRRLDSLYGIYRAFGPVPSKDMQSCRPLSPPPPRSGHLDIKDAQCAENKDVLKKSYHIILRFRVMGIQNDAQEI